MDIYEAKNATPNYRAPEQDYRIVLRGTYDFHRVAGKDVPIISKITIDKDNILHLEAWEPNKKATTTQRWRGAYEIKK